MSAHNSTIRHSETKDLTGKTFGRLHVLTFAGYRARPNGDRDAWWTCVCACGTRKDYRAYCLLQNITQSCGCIRQEKTIKRNTIHGKTKTPEHNVWCRMNQRCYDHNSQDFQNYGGRGIAVCETWRSSFSNFLADMGERPSLKHSIERLDNNLGYHPENCVWATRYVQQRNKRNSMLITYKGQTLCPIDWAPIVGIDEGTIRWRITHGWSAEKTLTQPSHLYHHKSPHINSTTPQPLAHL